MKNSKGGVPPPALGEDPVLAGRLMPPMGAEDTPLTGGTTAARPESLPGIPWKKKKIQYNKTQYIDVT